MKTISIRGGVPLCGEVDIGGSKNAALPILFGGILTNSVCVFSNLPRIGDVLTVLEILRALGAHITFLSPDEVMIDYRTVKGCVPPYAETARIRGSVYLLGAMLGRFGKAVLCGAGGCDFGKRPIDQHLMGFSRLGATVREGEGGLSLLAPKGLSGCEIELAMPSVGASANLLMAAVAAKGESVIQNAAAEPHVTALADFLRSAGAEIEGVGTQTLRITGGKPLHGCRFSMIPDMIEAGTYLAFAMATGGRITANKVEPTHLGAILQAFSDMGAEIEVKKDAVCLKAPAVYRGISVQTGPYPAFPTDMHPQLGALLCLAPRARGEGAIEELVWAERFRYTRELCRMGAEIAVQGNRATFTPARLHGAHVTAPDLRGGAALVIAALAAKGKTEIANASLIGRGYEHLCQKLRRLGAHAEIAE